VQGQAAGLPNLHLDVEQGRQGRGQRHAVTAETRPGHRSNGARSIITDGTVHRGRSGPERYKVLRFHPSPRKELSGGVGRATLPQGETTLRRRRLPTGWGGAPRLRSGENRRSWQRRDGRTHYRTPLLLSTAVRTNARNKACFCGVIFGLRRWKERENYGELNRGCRAAVLVRLQNINF
jgi:hypothetical protein